MFLVWLYVTDVVLDGNSRGKALNLLKIKKYAGNQFRRCVPAGTPCRDHVQIRRPVVQEVRTPSAHISRQRNSHVGFSYVLLLVFSRRYCVIMVSARGIDPCFKEELSYIKQKRSFGLSMFWVEYLMRARSGLDLNKANLLMDRDLFGACSDL